jgi:MFS family permease
MTLIGTAIMTGMSLSASFLPIMASALDPSGVLVGLVVSAWFFSRIFLEFPAGILSDRIGHRRLLIFGIALSCLGPLLCSTATNIWVLIIGRGIWGLGTSLYFMNNMALLMRILPQNVRGRSLGLFQGIEFLGSFVGAPIGAFLAIYFSFNQVFYFTLALTLFSLVVAWRSGSLRGFEDHKNSASMPSMQDILAIFKNLGIMIVCVSTLLRMLTMQGVFQTVLQIYLKNELAFGLEAIGLVVSMKILGQVPALIAAGILSDKIGRRPILLIGFGISAVSFLLLTQFQSFEALLLLNILAGVGEGLDMTTLMALLTDITPLNFRGGTIGIYRTFMDIGGFAGPIIFMVVYAYNSIAPFYLGAALSIINLLFISLIKTKISIKESSLKF